MTPEIQTYTFSRYLASKRSVDERALNIHVRQVLARELAAAAGSTARAEPLSVLEIGAGTGAMLERLLTWGLLPDADYTAIDLQPENIAEARRCLPESAARLGYGCELQENGDLLLAAGERQLRARLEASDVFDFIERGYHRHWDLLVAHAFLDLIDIPASLPKLFRLLRPGGMFYFTLNFDGDTIFEPGIDVALDERVMQLYHRTMDERITSGQPSGDSRSGRHLFANLAAAGAEVLAAGASDWVVYPHQRTYPEDEAYFLHFIIETISGALSGHPELDAGAFRRWVEARHRQVEAGELVYIAHQLDFVGRAPRG